MARLFAVENFPPAAEELRRLGRDVETTLEAGLAGQGISDPDVLAHASGRDRAVLTLNRNHFISLHRDRPEHAGIVACTIDPDFVGQANRIHLAVVAEAELSGLLFRVNRPGPESSRIPEQSGA